MMYKIIKEKYMIAKALIVVAISAVMLIFGKYATEGVVNGLYLCAQVLIPSLFPFMVLASFTVKSGISDFIGGFCEKFTKLLFGVSGKCGATILLSMIGGYPVGARGISTLYKSEKITKTEAEKLSYSLVSAGPGFLIVYIGINTLSSPNVGICILASQILSVIIIGFINKLIFMKDKNFSSQKELNYNNVPLSDALVDSVKDCTYAMLEMCGTVSLFSAVISIVEMNLKDLPHIFKYIAVLLEVTTASNILCVDGNILLLAFATGFAGLSIHFQVFQALKDIPFKKWLFITFRLIQGIITTAFTYIFLKLFSVSVPTYSSVANTDFALSTSVIGSILLLITGVCFLYNLKNYKN